MMVPAEEAPANFVPAAAVIRGEQALFGIIGRKGRVGGLHKSRVKALGLTEEGPWKLCGLSIGEEGGIPSVAVKCVDIGRNTCGEGGFLDNY
jgi:hypothetical protein